MKKVQEMYLFAEKLSFNQSIEVSVAKGTHSFL